MSTIIVDTWASFNFDLNDNGEGIFGLFECRECPKYASRWSWECFVDYYDNYGWSGMSDMFHRGQEAGRVYFTFEIMSIVFTIMIIERVAFYICQRDYANPFAAYIISLLSFLSHAIAMISWFTLSGANWTHNCNQSEDPKDRDDDTVLCAESGPALAIATFIFSFLQMIAFYIIWCKRDGELDCGKQDIKNTEICKLKYKSWLFLVFLMIIVNIGFIAGAWATESWTKRDADDDFADFKGSLYYYKDNVDKPSPDISEWGYDCKAGLDSCNSKTEGG